MRHSYATESLRLGAALQDAQDALGHADPRTTRRYDRSRHNLDRSPNYLLAAALTKWGHDMSAAAEACRRTNRTSLGLPATLIAQMMPP